MSLGVFFGLTGLDSVYYESSKPSYKLLQTKILELDFIIKENYQRKSVKPLTLVPLAPISIVCNSS